MNNCTLHTYLNHITDDSCHLSLFMPIETLPHSSFGESRPVHYNGIYFVLDNSTTLHRLLYDFQALF
jgi:hypothetical protein